MSLTKPPTDLRPLTSRVLTSLMDTLRPSLSGTRVLDLYSGFGRFGFECLKEGARSVEFVERDSQTCHRLKDQGERLSVLVHHQEVESFLSKTKTPFDVVFADPPFRMWQEIGFSERLVGLLAAVVERPGILVVRYVKKAVFNVPDGFELWKESSFGESQIAYLSPELK